MTLSRRNFIQLGAPAGPYTHAVLHKDTLYTSGFTAFGTGAQNGPADKQAHAILDQLDFIAGEYGKSLQDIVKVTLFVTDHTDIPSIREALAARYGKAVPASSLVLVSGLFAAGLKVEIEAIFAI